MYLIKEFKIIIKISFYLLIVLGCFLFTSCSTTKKNEETNTNEEKKVIEPNVTKRMEAARDKGGGIFNSSRSKPSGNFIFSTSNVLWRASLDALEFIPLNNVDYSGGVIVSDWYSAPGSKESIKITIRFLSNELSVSSLKIISHKKICENDGNCNVSLASDQLNEEIKKKIIIKAKKIKLEDEKNKG